MVVGTDTIFAVSSGGLPSAIAIVRLSGPQAGATLEKLAGSCPPPRMARLVTIRHPDTNISIDRAMAVWFPGPASATGEDVVEIHVHGGRAVIAALVSALSGLAGLRAAEAGEFSRRAFENAKLDLTEVEGLADLIAAETEAQRRQALAQLQGRLGSTVEEWRKTLIGIRASIEAALDFSEEQDVLGDGIEDLRNPLREFRFEIETKLADSGRGERIRDGIQVAVMGPPNAGKSSLMNAIAKRDVAIVTEQAGTTRDVIEVHLDLDGYPMTIADTAGLRDGAKGIEAEGIRRAVARGKLADLVLWVRDTTSDSKDVTAAIRQNARFLWSVDNKCDLLDSPPKRTNDKDCFFISVKSGDGLAEMTAALARFAREYCGGSEGGLITRERHRTSLREASKALKRAESLFDSEPELLAEELRVASDALARIVGRIDVEDLLDVVFAEFCIGK